MTEIQLKGGHTTSDSRLGRVPEFDDRSRKFNVADVVTPEIRSFTWQCDAHLDQGYEGSCVGNGWSHELSAVPVPVHGVTENFAFNVYREAQKVDQWPGEDYEGTSVIAGAKVISRFGYMKEYRWAFSTDDALRAISQHGPIVLGTNWLDSMFDPDPYTGLLDCSGEVAGGHCYLGRGNVLKRHFKGLGDLHVLRIRNSWGPGWGLGGDAYIRVEDLDRLLSDDGEVCVPVQRERIRIAQAL